MKKLIPTLLVALFVLGAIAQPPGAKLRKTVTTTVDTILVDLPSSTKTVSDSAVITKIEKLEELMVKQNKEINSRLRSMHTKVESSGRAGNFIAPVLRNTIPLMPFIAAVFIVFFWLRYVYRRKLLRQDLILKYIDRGEAVPEWLTQSESKTPIIGNPTPQNGEGTPKASGANSKLFLVLSIILAVWSIIWVIALVNTSGWRPSIVLLIAVSAFGYATFWCFQQFLKRTE